MRMIRSCFLILIAMVAFLGFCEQVNEIRVPIPIGAFSKVVIHSSCGFIVKNEDSPFHGIKSFELPQHYLAQMIWFEGSGFLEYRVKNPLPENAEIRTMVLHFEAGAGTLNSPTDLSVYMNGKKIGTFTITENHSGREGKFPLPKWWHGIQYGRLVSILIKDEGTYIKEDTKLKKISGVTVEDIDMGSECITIRIGVDEGVAHKGGMSLFGEAFGDFSVPLTLEFEYAGDKIYQPKIAKIIDHPERYENKTVILVVHPGGWSCPSGKSTRIPKGFSRSATTMYDETGCIYGTGKILVGKILSPELHKIYEPGNETIVIEGKIKLDEDGIPYVSSP